MSKVISKSIYILENNLEKMVKKKMTNEEFINCSSIDRRTLHEISELLDKEEIKDIRKRLEFVADNYSGQHYIYFALKETDDVILKNFHDLSDKFVISKNSIDHLLRAFLFATQYMQEGLPEHVFDYIKSNSNMFFYDIIKEYNKQGIE